MPAAPGSGTPPAIQNLQNTCSTAGVSTLTFSISKGIAGATCEVTLTDADGNEVWAGGLGQYTNAQSFTIKGKPNGDYTLTADNGEAQVSTTLTIACSGLACDLVLVQLTTTDPATASALGSVAVQFTTAATGSVQLSIAGPQSAVLTLPGPSGGGQLDNLPAGDYTFTLSLADLPDCQRSGSFTLNAAPPVDPSLGLPARWEPVGGVLPNPVLLAVEASLTDAQGLPRAGLHVEVELYRPGASEAFAAFQATVRTASQLVDAAPYLRGQLVAAIRYAAGSSPFLDADAALAFAYRFRVVDGTGAEAWQVRAGERYAVLAALPLADDTMAPYVADSLDGRVASVFADREATQFVGYPLEVSVLLPPYAESDRFAQLRYLGGAGQELEIRALLLPDPLPAGLLRIPLPADPLPCAASVEVSLVDEDNSYAGSCPDGGTITTGPGSGGYLLTNNGRLRL